MMANRKNLFQAKLIRLATKDSLIFGKRSKIISWHLATANTRNTLQNGTNSEIMSAKKQISEQIMYHIYTF